MLYAICDHQRIPTSSDEGNLYKVYRNPRISLPSFWRNRGLVGAWSLGSLCPSSDTDGTSFYREEGFAALFSTGALYCT
jgi:hypothetical protein